MDGMVDAMIGQALSDPQVRRRWEEEAVRMGFLKPEDLDPLPAAEEPEPAAAEEPSGGGGGGEGGSATTAAQCAIETGVPHVSGEDLRVGPSLVTSGGLGLFAARDFAAGSMICVYTGDVLRTQQALRLTDKSFLMRLGPQAYVDALPHPSVAARYINDCRNPRGFNVVFDKRPDQGVAAVVALRVVRGGEELFADYGKMYWATLQPQRLSNEALGLTLATVVPTPTDAILARRRQHSAAAHADEAEGTMTSQAAAQAEATALDATGDVGDDPAEGSGGLVDEASEDGRPAITVLNLQSLNPALDWLPDEFGADVFRFRGLESASFADNALQRLPTNFLSAAGASLTSLDLSRNTLEGLPEHLGLLRALRVLRCDANCLLGLPETVGDLACLQSLSLSSNDLRALPASLVRCGALQELNLQGNDCLFDPASSPSDPPFALAPSELPAPLPTPAPQEGAEALPANGSGEELKQPASPEERCSIPRSLELLAKRLGPSSDLAVAFDAHHGALDLATEA